jgi:hypothetical protein
LKDSLTVRYHSCTREGAQHVGLLEHEDLVDALAVDEVLLVGVGGAVTVEDGYHGSDDTATGPAALRAPADLTAGVLSVRFLDGDHRLPMLCLRRAA